MSRVCRRFLATTAALCLCVTLADVSQVKAYADQASADLSIGGTQIEAHSGLPSTGGELLIGGGYGLGDMFVLRASLGYGLFHASRGTASVGRVRAEAAYLLDVLSVVPFFGLGVGGWLYERNGPSVSPSGHVLFGVDLLWTREWNVGLDGRLGLLLISDDPFMVGEAQLRLSRVFDLF